MLGGNALRLRAGALALGLPGKTIQRNAAGCRGNARCLQGCPNSARQSMDVSYIPDAVRSGARSIHWIICAQIIPAGEAWNFSGLSFVSLLTAGESADHLLKWRRPCLRKTR